MTFSAVPSSLLIGSSLALLMREVDTAHSSENHLNGQNTEKEKKEKSFKGHLVLSYLLGSSLTINQRFAAGFGVAIGTGLIAKLGFHLGNDLDLDPSNSAMGGLLIGNLSLSYFLKTSPFIAYSFIGTALVWYGSLNFFYLASKI